MLCECGCGHDAGVYHRTRQGHVEGEPKKFFSIQCVGHIMGKLNTGTAVNKGQRSTHCKCGLPRTPENTNSNGWCRICCNAAQARWKEKHPHASRGGHYYARYGVTREQFNAQIEKQNGKCAICHVVLDYENKAASPTLDHAHDAAKKFRGVLCHMCNTGLGLFRDTPDFLQSAIQYLKETQ